MSGFSNCPEVIALVDHRKKMGDARISSLFADDTKRFDQFSLRLPGILFDYSKNLMTTETLALLLKLAQTRGVEVLRDKMLKGDKINTTDNRAVLHTALRSNNPPPEVQETLASMAAFCNKVRAEKKITNIVSIGIGGSSLGPSLVVQALAGFQAPHLRAHFVSNVEASDLETTLSGLKPESTLFIIVSKSFTTAETALNATAAKRWFLQNSADKDMAAHFVSASTNIAAAKDFGIAPENVFPFWDWVGGRFSVWSAAGLCAMLMIGPENFRAFLDGAGEMDRHFAAVAPAQNMPMLMGLIGVWRRSFCNQGSYVVAPYHAQLSRFPAWLQQIDMESNGKCVTRNGDAVDGVTGALVFGEPGTDAQHSFFQWMHQGTDIVPTDFIAVVKTPYGRKAQQNMLLSHCLAQSAALMDGHSNKGEPHRDFPGNRPSSTILLDELTPHKLGMLMALYEHKVFVEGAIWGINSFDQWGVELGKTLAKKVEGALAAGDSAGFDASTDGLLQYISEII